MPHRTGPGSFTSLTPTERLSTLARSARTPDEPFLLLARSYTEHLYSPRRASDSATAHAGALRAYRRLSRWRSALSAMTPDSLVRRGAGFPLASLQTHGGLVQTPGRERHRPALNSKESGVII